MPSQMMRQPAAASCAVSLFDFQLPSQDAQECVRPAAHLDHARRHAVRLPSDGYGPHTLGVRRDHTLVAAGEAADIAELIAGDQDRLRIDRVCRHDVLEDPRDRIGLVGKPDLDVLAVARDARVRQPAVPGDRRRESHHLTDALDARRLQPSRRCRDQRLDLCLGRVVPLRQRNQVDLAAVQPVVDDPRLHAPPREPPPQFLRRVRQYRFLRGRGDALVQRDALAAVAVAPYF